jgi:hypothetical protein
MKPAHMSENGLSLCEHGHFDSLFQRAISLDVVSPGMDSWCPA